MRVCDIKGPGNRVGGGGHCFVSALACWSANASPNDLADLRRLQEACLPVPIVAPQPQAVGLVTAALDR